MMDTDGGRAGRDAKGRRPRARWKRALHSFAHSRRTKMATGVFLLITALAGLTEGLFLDLHETLEPSHALLVLGALLVMQSLAEFLEAAEFIDQAESDED